MKLKQFLPYEKYILATKLPEKEVLKRIADNVTPDRIGFRSYQSNTSGKPYEGYMLGSTFNIHRIIDYKNSFFPFISGKVYQHFGETYIGINMRPHKFVLGFMCVWLGGVGVACLILLFGLVMRFKEFLKSGISFSALIPFVMFAFGYGLLFFAFKNESKKSKLFLEKLVEGHEVEVNKW
jgi:hypothetical protein